MISLLAEIKGKISSTGSNLTDRLEILDDQQFSGTLMELMLGEVYEKLKSIEMQ